MKDFNGNTQNQTIRMYENLNEVPEHYQREYDMNEHTLFPVFQLLDGGCDSGLFESVRDALRA